MKAHFVTFYSPGTFCAEESTQPMDSWDVAKAQNMADSISERYGATPYAFQFMTRSRGPDDLDSKVSDRSPMYFINCRVETLDEVIERDDPDESILRSNMKSNGWDRIAITTKGWKWTKPIGDDDVVLEEVVE
jgi:hypothetical protein